MEEAGSSAGSAGALTNPSPGGWLANASFDASGLVARHAAPQGGGGDVDRAALLQAAAAAMPSSSEEEDSDSDIPSPRPVARSASPADGGGSRQQQGGPSGLRRGDGGAKHRKRDRKDKAHKQRKAKRQRSETDKLRDLERKAAAAGLGPARSGAAASSLLASMGLGGKRSTAAALGTPGSSIVLDTKGDPQNLVYESLYAGGRRADSAGILLLQSSAWCAGRSLCQARIAPAPPLQSNNARRSNSSAPRPPATHHAGSVPRYSRLDPLGLVGDTRLRYSWQQAAAVEGATAVKAARYWAPANFVRERSKRIKRIHLGARRPHAAWKGQQQDRQAGAQLPLFLPLTEPEPAPAAPAGGSSYLFASEPQQQEVSGAAAPPAAQIQARAERRLMLLCAGSMHR
jgi:hypothetical protein